jgi:hypothetical protein
LVAPLKTLRTVLKRLPKNLMSNRWWVVWSGRLFISTHRKIVLIPQEKASERPLGEWADSLPRYVSIFSWLSAKQNFRGDQTALLLNELGMFGNMTKRLAAALTLAGPSGVGHIVIPPAAEFHRDLFSRTVHVFHQLNLWFCAQKPASQNPIKVLLKTDLLYVPGSRYEFSEQEANESWANLHTALIPHATKPALPSDHMVIHLRGGDVFGPRKPAAYGQPPLGYYELLLDSRSWSAVTIVHEDLRNPVLAPLLEGCRQRGLPVFEQSGSVQEDIAFLLRAQTLVAGRGTFVPAIAGLSRHAKEVFYFEDKFTLFPPVPGLRLTRVVDGKGDYVRQALSKNWANTQEQRDLMVTYPATNLFIES